MLTVKPVHNHQVSLIQLVLLIIYLLYLLLLLYLNDNLHAPPTDRRVFNKTIETAVIQVKQEAFILFANFFFT